VSRARRLNSSSSRRGGAWCQGSSNFPP
jgi:hypothetical protein